MDFKDRLAALSKKIIDQGKNIQTEEATKNAFVMPFLHNVLGYDIFNPLEVIPEFTADTGIKKGEKVDYAILRDGEIQILLECKKYGDKISAHHASQLFRYFAVTNARIAILTNGSVYQFFTDLDAPNKMDEKPFMELDLERVDDQLVPELKKLAKEAFNLGDVISSAGELKYLSQIKKLIAAQFNEPDDAFVKMFASQVYPGAITQKIRDQFAQTTKKALSQFLRDKINERLQNAMEGVADMMTIPEAADQPDVGDIGIVDNGEKIVTTEEEMEGYHIVRALLREVVSVARVAKRDTQSYFGVLLDDNNRKPICRLRFNHAQKYIGLFDENKIETKHAIGNLDELYGFAEQLKKTVVGYL